MTIRCFYIFVPDIYIPFLWALLSLTHIGPLIMESFHTFAPQTLKKSSLLDSLAALLSARIWWQHQLST
ncbi:hypothetical protein I7I50_02382 [Histoplasma capsulatum G186AR]|uniref:Uncharacterized protein n=1 Tax=Ajellomyces capsulatus TaxID=5037 RepID=A0A8H7Z8A3_AJECA|nr:hypothetical protein I7I52_00954 [Histoplasma capsulatum]QSS71523.1 hypothetical protein I7I50_02382 [Histoplasma capsulatum G186AR]